MKHRYILDEGSLDSENVKKTYHFTASGFLPGKKINAYEKCEGKNVKSFIVKSHGWDLICIYTVGIYCIRKVEFECY